MTTTVELRKCPLCGSSASMRRDFDSSTYRARCDDENCACEGPEYMSEATAAERWNTRPKVGEAVACAGAYSLALLFHATYEELAPSFGYETRKETREFDAASPNGKLMIAVCERLWRQFANPPSSVDEAQAIPGSALCALLPQSYYMDPPDGGDVAVYEQLRRMAKDAARYRWLRARREGCQSDMNPWVCIGKVGVILSHWNGEPLDKAIDAAMAEAAEGDTP